MTVSNGQSVSTSAPSLESVVRMDLRVTSSVFCCMAVMRSCLARLSTLARRKGCCCCCWRMAVMSAPLKGQSWNPPSICWKSFRS